MRTLRFVRHAVAAALGLVAASVAPASYDGWTFDLPKGFPAPRVPADNPMTEAKVRLGRHLFYDARLSGNERQSCATCHVQALAFTDGRARAIGSRGDEHPRSSMSLANMAYASVLTWANPSIHRLEEQALVPILGTSPIELGMSAPGDDLIARLKKVQTYQTLFVAAFPGDPEPVTLAHLTQALASFERTIISSRSSYDRYHYAREDDAISAAAKRGEVLFFSRPLSCFTCHGGFNFSGGVETSGRVPREAEFHNTGLYNVAGRTSYPEPNTGVFEITHDPKDVGKFKAPTLRNIAVTAPYMHDGSIATLEEVLDHYAAGGRTVKDGRYAGVGHDNPNKSATLQGFTLTSEQRADLVAFLTALTDEALLTDQSLGSPWRRER